MLSIYTRHSAHCPRSADRNWKRCRCPKWVWGTVNDEFIRRSAKTRSWEHAEEFRRNLEQKLIPAPAFHTLENSPTHFIPPADPVQAGSRPSHRVQSQERKRITIQFAVDKYLTDARSRDLEKSTLSKLETTFRKQFLIWAIGEGFEYLDEIDLDAVQNFRSTWTDGALAKSKKQERLIGFFWSCVRRGYITHNPTLEIGKIKVVHVPTDYFPRDEFNKIVDTTYIYGDPRGGFIPLEDLRIRIRAMTLIMRWSGTSYTGCRDAGEDAATGRRSLSLSGKDRNTRLCSSASFCRQDAQAAAARSQAKPKIFFLERKWRPQKRRCELAASFSEAI